MQKATLYVLFLLSLIPLSGLAQQSKEKAAKLKRYESYKASSADDASFLLEEAYTLKDKRPGEALNRVEEALGISIARKDEFNEAKCYVLIGEINEGIQEWKLANDNFLTAYEKLITKYRGTLEFEKTLMGLGSTSLKLKQYAQSIRYYDEALKLNAKGGDKGRVFLAIAEVRYEEGNYDEALRMLKNVPSKKRDSGLEVSVQNLEARILAKRNELTSSSKALDNSISSLKTETAVKGS
jgi:tetratricopeptide (TPR) repeat protein